MGVARGDVWIAATGGDYAGKPRPVLIVQSDLFPETDSVTVCLITSLPSAANLTRLPVAPEPANGLRQPSWLMIDKLTTIPKSKLGTRVGALGRGELAAFDKAAILFLGLTTASRPGVTT
jgi:mRNA interferase MazF